MRLWSIKYVFTEGIEELDWDWTFCDDRKYARFSDGRVHRWERMGRDIFDNRPAAVEAAKKKIGNKIASLIKQQRALVELAHELDKEADRE